MLPAMLTLWHVPDVRNAIPPGGLLGHLVSAGLLAAFNTVGANLVAVAIFVVALFLTTKFSFMETHETLRGPLSKLNVIAPLKERLPSGVRNAKRSACKSALPKSSRKAGRRSPRNPWPKSMAAP